MRASDMPPDEITLGELVRWINRIETQQTQAFAAMERQLDSLRFVTTDRYDAEQKAHLDRTSKLEDDSRWSRRAQVTTMLTVLASTVTIYLQAKGAL